MNLPSVAETQSVVAAHCPVLDPERLPLAESGGRILREDVLAPEDIPAFDRAAMDGFAVRRDDPGPAFEVVDEIRAGQHRKRVLAPGQAVRIYTGAALPADGLQVVMQEDTELKGDRLLIRRRSPDLHIRFRGEDAGRGACLLPAGTRLGPGEVSLLASLGSARPLVSRHPAVAHFTTGDELVPPETAPQQGQIRDSNSTLIRALLLEGGVNVRQAHLPEDAEVAWQRLGNESWEAADLLLFSGGASVGRHDHTGALLERLGFRRLVSKVNARPGKPLIFAIRGNQAAFGLPGNPLSHLVCFHLFVAVALRRMLGLPAIPPLAQGFLGAELGDCESPRETFWPASARLIEGRMEITPARWQSSGDVTALPGVGALLRVPPGTTSRKAGDAIEFLPTRWLG